MPCWFLAIEKNVTKAQIIRLSQTFDNFEESSKVDIRLWLWQKKQLTLFRDWLFEKLVDMYADWRFCSCRQANKQANCQTLKKNKFVCLPQSDTSLTEGHPHQQRLLLQETGNCAKCSQHRDCSERALGVTVSSQVRQKWASEQQEFNWFPLVSFPCRFSVTLIGSFHCSTPNLVSVGCGGKVPMAQSLAGCQHLSGKLSRRLSAMSWDDTFDEVSWNKQLEVWLVSGEINQTSFIHGRINLLWKNFHWKVFGLIAWVVPIKYCLFLQYFQMILIKLN